MNLQSVFIFSSFFLSIIAASCQMRGSKNNNTEIANDEFVKKVTQLDEFKLAEKRVDSLKNATGIPLQLTIDVVGQSFLKEDTLKNISLAFINEGVEFEKHIVYTVKYDKDQKKIISVQKNESGLNKENDILPADTKL